MTIAGGECCHDRRKARISIVNGIVVEHYGESDSSGSIYIDAGGKN